MLKQRVITAALLVPIMLAGIFWLPLTGFAVFIGAITLLGAWEWAALSGFSSTPGRAGFVLLCGFVLALLGWQWGGVSLAVSRLLWLLPVVVVWLFALIWVARYPTPGSWRLPSIRLLTGLIVLAGAWWSLLQLKKMPNGNSWILLMMLIVWAADIGAYFSGKRWGKRKLAVQVSPGKTREGVYGGLLLVAVVTGLYSWWLSVPVLSAVMLVLLALLIAGVSVLGDLFESLLKRHVGLKDSGSLLPGHGGVLDRIDSVLAAAPFFFVGLSIALALG